MSGSRACECRLAGWEIASWTLACLIALVVLAASIQKLNDDRMWSYMTVPPKSTCTHIGCVPRGIPK